MHVCIYKHESPTCVLIPTCMRAPKMTNLYIEQLFPHIERIPTFEADFGTKVSYYIACTIRS